MVLETTGTNSVELPEWMRPRDGGCVWAENADDYYDTGCGQAFIMESGTPYENGMHYCCYCGKGLVEVRHAEPEEG